MGESAHLSSEFDGWPKTARDGVARGKDGVTKNLVTDAVIEFRYLREEDHKKASPRTNDIHILFLKVREKCEIS